MFKFKKKNALIASVLVGSILFTPLATTNVAYADSRPNVYNYGDRIFNIETDTIDPDFQIKGIHYIALWMVELQQLGVSNLIPVIGAFTKERTNLGYQHVIIKFEEDGSYHGESLIFNNKEKGEQRKKDEPKMVNWWINALKNTYLPKNDERYYEYEGKDIYDPRNWHDTKYARRADDNYTLNRNAIENIAEYLKENRPDLVRQNIALNKRDEAKSLEQHKVEVQQSKDNALTQKAQAADAHHNSILKTYNDYKGKDVKSVLNGLGSYNWDMFLNEGATRPNIDVNMLINNVWYLDYVGSNKKFKEFHAIVRFKPVFWAMQDTGEILWENSLIEMSVLYEADENYNNRQYFDHEEFYLEQNRSDGCWFTPNISIMPSKAPDDGGEKKIIMVSHKPGEGDFRTVSASSFSYKFRTGYTGRDFWLMEHDNGKPTDWAYHLTMIQ